MHYLLLISTFLFCETALSAEIVLLNKNNFEDFVKNNLAVAFCCDYDHDEKCGQTVMELLKAVDTLTMEDDSSIKFGIIDYIKNEWFKLKVNGITPDTFVVFHYGKYDKFWAPYDWGIVKTVKNYKGWINTNPTYFSKMNP